MALTGGSGARVWVRPPGRTRCWRVRHTLAQDAAAGGQLSMTTVAAAIHGWHAHVYYEPATRAAAAAVREGIAAAFPQALLGRWHDAPIGPHTRAMYQVAFAPALLPELLPWLMLNRRGLAVLVHPETGRELADHTTHAAWLGEVLSLRTEVLAA
jgi:DOPA 4,5-dioxygenase